MEINKSNLKINIFDLICENYIKNHIFNHYSIIIEYNLPLKLRNIVQEFKSTLL